MTDSQTKSWIFLATALASQTEPADYEAISDVADAINHAVPTHKELQTSLAWLLKNDLVSKSVNKYRVTNKGLVVYASVSRQTETLSDIWDKLATVLTQNLEP